MSISEIVEANGPIFVVIFGLLSIASVALVAWRALLNLNAKTNMDEFLDRFEKQYQAGGLQSALDMCQRETGLVPKLFVTAIEQGKNGHVAARRAIEDQIEMELVPSLNRLLPPMLLFTKIAPMLGLLGTVVGMILAFGKIAGAVKVDPSALSRDIGMALFTTAEGLIIAIPLIFAYTMFRERVQRFELDLQRGAQVAVALVPKIYPAGGGMGARTSGA